MNIPKGLIKKLGVFKSNSALLVPIAIGLVGALLFIPAQLMSGNLKKRIEAESISKSGRQVDSLIRSAVARRQWEMEAKRQQEYANDANQTALLSKQSTQRALLSYKVFPKPQDTSMLIFKEFGQRYRKGIDMLIVRMNAHDCPTGVELQRALENSPANLRSGRRTSTLRSSSRVSQVRFSEVGSKIVDEVCRERAESISVYANPMDLSGYGYWGEYQYDAGIEKAVGDCWYYQLAYWIIEDIVDTIRVRNAGSGSVLASPVKRIVGVNFDLSRGSARRSRSSRSGAREEISADRPVYVLSSGNASIEPCTGRSSNDNIDIVHFSFTVVVNAEEVLSFMQQLCSAKEHKFAGFDGSGQERTFKHNQITILESRIRSIDRDGQYHRFYRYGENAVVELSLVCEYIFNKSGYDEIKPESVKEALKVDVRTRRY